jgi:serine/arginine repetitive matrix protein 2
MEQPYAQPQPVPRLRLSRQPLVTVADRLAIQDENHAGPSRPRDPPVGDRSGDTAGGDDHQPTPKGHPNSNASPPAEAAARLRALLNRTKPPVARPVSPSEVESDFDPPRFSPTNTPSVFKESLKDLFSHALRDPGDTPVKGKPRRNSIDTSEVEASPRVRERAKNKGKRKSLSDEEADKPSSALHVRFLVSGLTPRFTPGSSQRSEASFRSSHAATLDILRERLNSSHTPLKNQFAPTPLYDSAFLKIAF